MAEQQQLYHPGDQQLKLEDEGELRNVTVQKDLNKPLGATIRKVDGRLVIVRIVTGGVCDRIDCLRVGDRLISVNGKKLTEMTESDVSTHLRSLSGQLIFSVSSDPNQNMQTTHVNADFAVRALFRYSANDAFNPCKELQMAFEPGDIIRVVNTDDPDLWQGFKKSDKPSDLAKLLPSHRFLSKRFKSKSSRKFYERQSRFVPQSEQHRSRSIVLVGLAAAGVHELRASLLESNPDTLDSAVTHTTRERKPEEQDGLDYCFVSQTQFNRLQLIETYEFNGDLYGTCVNSVQDVAKNGKICVLTLLPENLPTIRSHGASLLPYVVFVKPPSGDRLRELRRHLDHYSELAEQEPLTDRQIRDIVSRSNKIENDFRHMFDRQLVLNNLEESSNELRDLISHLQTQPQWVPTSWLHTEPGQLSDTEFDLK